jgi:hypothetical protein
VDDLADLVVVRRWNLTANTTTRIADEDREGPVTATRKKYRRDDGGGLLRTPCCGLRNGKFVEHAFNYEPLVPASL